MPTAYTKVAWKSGSRIKADPVLGFEEIQELNRVNGGFAPDGALVQQGQKKSSVFHKDFYSLSKAEMVGEWLLNMERKIYRSIMVTMAVEEGDGTSEPLLIEVRQSWRDTEPDSGKKVWRDITDMLSDPEGRQRLLEKAHKDMQHFVSRYRVLHELSHVIKPIEEYLEA